MKYDRNISPHLHFFHGTNSHRAEKQYTENGHKQRERERVEDSVINVAERLILVVD